MTAVPGGFIAEVANVLCLVVPTRFAGGDGGRRGGTALRTVRAAGAARAQGQEGPGTAWDTEMDVDMDMDMDMGMDLGMDVIDMRNSSDEEVVGIRFEGNNLELILNDSKRMEV